MITVRLQTYTSEELLAISKVKWEVFTAEDKLTRLHVDTKTGDGKELLKVNLAQAEGVPYYVYATPFTVDVDTGGAAIEKQETTVGPFKSMNLAGAKTVEIYGETIIETPTVKVSVDALHDPLSSIFTVECSKLRAIGEVHAATNWYCLNSEGETIYRKLNSTSRTKIVVNKSELKDQMHGRHTWCVSHIPLGGGVSGIGRAVVNASTFTFNVQANLTGLEPSTDTLLHVTNLDGSKKDVYGIALYDGDKKELVYEELNVHKSDFLLPEAYAIEGQAYELHVYETSLSFTKKSILIKDVVYRNAFKRYYRDYGYMYNYKVTDETKAKLPFTNRKVEELDGPVTIDFDTQTGIWYKTVPGVSGTTKLDYKLSIAGATRVEIKQFANFKFLITIEKAGILTVKLVQYYQGSDKLLEYASLTYDGKVDDTRPSLDLAGVKLYFLNNTGVMIVLNIKSKTFTTLGQKPSFSKATSIVAVDSFTLYAFSASTDGYIYRLDTVRNVWSKAIKVQASLLTASFEMLFTRDNRISMIPTNGVTADVLSYDFLANTLKLEDTGATVLKPVGFYLEKSGRVKLISITDDHAIVNTFK